MHEIAVVMHAFRRVFLFRKPYSETFVPSAPEGVSELDLSVVDDRRKVHYRFHGQGAGSTSSDDTSRIIAESMRMLESPLLDDAFNGNRAMSLELSSADGWRKYVYMLPFERRRNKWRHACLQVTALPPDPDKAETSGGSILSRERVFFVIADANQVIRSVSSSVPESFGYPWENLLGLEFKDLFNPSDCSRLKSCAADTNEVALRCPFFCLDGSKRDASIRKYSLPDKYFLYGICDVSPRQRGEDLTEATARERQRIGQDLHDSIGQTLTGISLLSRSLANILKRDKHNGSDDASQISELADDASNQIRQISRGLMPSEVVQNGLFASLRELARVTTNSCGITCDVQLEDALVFSDVAVQTHLYRIAQEAVNNAVRHSAADRIDIVVSSAGGMPQLEVVDDGRWVEPEANVIGVGLKTMEYRASAVGGRLHIGTTPQGGTSICCRMESDDSLATKVDRIGEQAEPSRGVGQV